MNKNIQASGRHYLNKYFEVAVIVRIIRILTKFMCEEGSQHAIHCKRVAKHFSSLQNSSKKKKQKKKRRRWNVHESSEPKNQGMGL
mmetsp:Transcript_6997/g.11763  ORF Transcript_6997/g.11763 Transcript_6997/m.11763 type:complete len:86 (+) Transcript_6997:19-276(+)